MDATEPKPETKPKPEVNVFANTIDELIASAVKLRGDDNGLAFAVFIQAVEGLDIGPPPPGTPPGAKPVNLKILNTPVAHKMTAPPLPFKPVFLVGLQMLLVNIQKVLEQSGDRLTADDLRNVFGDLLAPKRAIALPGDRGFGPPRRIM